jgi:hypothetical protein
MHRIIPCEKDTAAVTIEKRPADSPDEFRADSGVMLGIRFFWLCPPNLAVNGPEGNIHHSGQFDRDCDDLHDGSARFDFILANPPFNFNAADKKRLKDMVGYGLHGNARRSPFDLPRTGNAEPLDPTPPLRARCPGLCDICRARERKPYSA